MVFGSGAAQEMHRRWFENHLNKFKVQYKNRSDEFHGISIAGPNSRKVLEKIVREDVSNEKFIFNTAFNSIFPIYTFYSTRDRC